MGLALGLAPCLLSLALHTWIGPYATSVRPWAPSLACRAALCSPQDFPWVWKFGSREMMVPPLIPNPQTFRDLQADCHGSVGQVWLMGQGLAHLGYNTTLTTVCGITGFTWRVGWIPGWSNQTFTEFWEWISKIKKRLSYKMSEKELCKHSWVLLFLI